ncbi:TPA: holin family protein, partial [Enterococcus faecium]
SSEIGFEGLLKKVLIFVVIAVAVEVQKIVGNSIPLREIVIMFYVANEGISFLENISVFLPLPDKLKEVFQQIRNDTENKDRGGTK